MLLFDGHLALHLWLVCAECLFPPTTWQKVPETLQPLNTSPERLTDLGLQFLLEHLTFTTPVASFSKHFDSKLIFQLGSLVGQSRMTKKPLKTQVLH